MPNYIFRCPKCGKEIELTLPVNHINPECEECQKQMNNVMSPSTIIYKGSGFYTTDYGKGKS